ncbi:MAG TPA: hypothetical protein VEK15_06185 [Vicinamibacteria bacterium]|nr:hypothetical protein [Vicinamibacteria bacterium]
MNVFEVWLESWTMTDSIFFGTVGLVIIAVVFLRPLLASRRDAGPPQRASSDNGS